MARRVRVPRGRPEPGGDTHNVFTGVADVVVQARTIYRGVHVHLDGPVPRIGTRAALVWFIAAGGLAAGAIWFVRARLAERPHTPGGIVAAAVGLLVLALALRMAHTTWQWWRLSRERATEADRRRRTAAAVVLAEELGRQWATEARLRRLPDPFPLPVSWVTASQPLTDQWPNVRATADAPGPDAPLDLSGAIGEPGADIAEVFARVPSRRLVVLGAAGAGKSVLVLRLARALLAARDGGDPIPVILPAASWNPGMSGMRQWIAERLALEFPHLGARMATGHTLAAELVRSGSILPIIDGLDEMPAAARPRALRELNAALDAGDPVVLTSRPDEYRATAEKAGVPVGAAAVTVNPLRPADLAAYLSRVGMAQMCPDPSTNARKLVAAPPELALAGVLTGIQREVRQTHEKLLGGYQRLNAVPGTTAPSETRDFANQYVEVITERSEITRMSVSLMNAARSDWMSLENLATETPKYVTGAEPPLPVLKGEVRCRSIWEAGYMDDPGGADAIRQCVEAGEEARLLPSIPMKLKIVDDRAALLPLTATGMGGALLVRSYVIVSALREYFELLWERAVPVGSKKSYTNTPLSELDFEILQLMGEGKLDDEVASKLRLSVPTMRRHFDGIRKELGVTSRFAAGVAAHRRGWVQ